MTGLLRNVVARYEQYINKKAITGFLLLCVNDIPLQIFPHEDRIRITKKLNQNIANHCRGFYLAVKTCKETSGVKNVETMNLLQKM